MIDPKPKRPVGRPPKNATAKLADAAPAPVVKATAKVALPPAAATVPVAAKVPPAPVAAAKPAAVKPAPLPKVAEKIVEAPAKAAAPAKIVEVAKAAPVAAIEKVADVAATVVEKTAAIPAAVATAVTSLPAAQPAQKGFFTMAETISPKSFVPTPESFQAIFGDVSTRAKTAFENSAKLAEEVGEFAKGNVEALLTSSRVAAKGAETLGQEAASYSKKSLETATTAFKGFASAKSPTELFKLQSDYARSSFDAAVAESSKFSEALLKLFGEITQPISTRVALAAEKIKTPAF